MPNELQFEKSPYLLQHRHQPVPWLPWGERAFTLAREKDKPIFLSIGYSTCHWCHVMAHESFDDETVAAVLDRIFVPVKVDREERPDVDAAYMAACTAMTGSGGWPLTVLLTPEGKPFWAGTYLPKPALLSLAEQVERLWLEDRDSLLAAGEELTAFLRQEPAHRPGDPSRALVVEAAAEYARLFDPEWGGFGRPPKFPTAHNLLFLLRYADCAENDSARESAEKTLQAMYCGGLFDHVGGGFSRYSTDRRWLVPHFEKMLYDNALLLFTYAEAFQRTGRPLYETAARRTADYVLRELEAPEGGFFCGQDADSEGVEGKYYVFTPEELRAVLGEEDAERFCRRYGITEAGNFEGKNIPNLIGQENPEQEPEDMENIRKRLRRYRLERTVLHRDDKILTSWNGLMIAALAKAGQVFREPRYLEAAERAAVFLLRELRDGNGRLFARWREGERAVPGKLDDYAFLAWGFWELYAATLRLPCLLEAQMLAEQLLEGFFDRENGGLYPYAADDEQLITRNKEVYDGAMPSGNAVGALVFSRLARLTGETRWREAANLQLAFLAGAVQDYPAGYGFTMLVLLEELWPTAELVCAAREVPEELRLFLRREAKTGLTVLMKTPENRDALAAFAPFTKEYPIPPEGATYYLCRGGACQRPVSDIAALPW